MFTSSRYLPVLVTCTYDQTSRKTAKILCTVHYPPRNKSIQDERVHTTPIRRIHERSRECRSRFKKDKPNPPVRNRYYAGRSNNFRAWGESRRRRPAAERRKTREKAGQQKGKKRGMLIGRIGFNVGKFRVARSGRGARTRVHESARQSVSSVEEEEKSERTGEKGR